jgi:thiol:disulfide interchange protein DsbC
MKSNAIRAAVAAALATLGLAAALAQAQVSTLPPAGARPAAGAPAAGSEAAVRKALTERAPSLGTIDEVTRTPIPGLFEVRVGTELFYADAEGNYLINGQIIDLRAKRNLTEDRLEKLLALDFDALPARDAFTIVRGNGKRKLAVFEDPNCGYCKRFERDMQKIDNVTVYLYLLPILGPDSMEKSKAIWCSRDKGKAWLDLMVRNTPVPKVEGACDTAALDRNVAFAKKNKITGTPTLVFADGSRVPGAIAAADVEKLLAGDK